MLLHDAVVISRRFERCALLGHYTSQSGNFLPTIRDNLSVRSSRTNKSKFFNFLILSWISRPLRMGPIGCPEASARNSHYTLLNSPEGRISHSHRGESLKSRTEGPIWFPWKRTKSILTKTKIATQCLLFVLGAKPSAGHGLLIHVVSRSHTTTHHSRKDSSGRVISS
jgi:hypothetical protein